MIGMVAITALVALSLTAPGAPQIHKSKMEELSFLIGAWSGEGWQMRGEAKDLFTGTEAARWSAGGTAMIIEGHQKNGAGADRYNGLVVITWNASKNCYRLTQQTSGGSYAEYEAQLKDKTLTWQLRENLSITLVVKDGEWLEEGFMVSGDTKSKIFELKMKKKPDEK